MGSVAWKCRVSYEVISSLDSLLGKIDALQEQVNGAKAVLPDAYARIMEG